MKIAIASGKGGTGKTTIATNMAVAMAEAGTQTVYVDCDVEEPNGHIFLKPKIIRTTSIGIPCPVVDESKCTGCQLCLDACPFTPRRIIWHPGKGRAIKCDLCLDTPYWDERGGPDGKQICVEVCPQQAIRFSREVPEQAGDSGYEVNFREQVPR